MADPRKQLVDYLDEHAFDPVLNASTEGMTDDELLDFEDVHRATESAKDRYHEYESAEKVKEMFEDDLQSDETGKVTRKLERLGLPTLPEVKVGFMELCDEFGVE